jgi:type IV pilus assembly protein PilA
MQTRKRFMKGFTCIEFVMVAAIVGILVAIAIPKFNRFQTLAIQSEAKSNLKGLFKAQKTWFQANNSYSTQIDPLGFSPPRGNRYAYRLGFGALQPRDTETLPVSTTPYEGVNTDTFTLGMAHNVPEAAFVRAAGTPNAGAPGVYERPSGKAHFLATATGNADNELMGMDSWYVSSESAWVTPTPCSGPRANVPGGKPFNTHDDMTCN